MLYLDLNKPLLRLDGTTYNRRGIAMMPPSTMDPSLYGQERAIEWWKVEVTIGDAVQHACLTAPPPDEKSKSAASESFERFKLAQKLSSDGTVELSAEEIALAKQCVGAVYKTEVLGTLWLALEEVLPDPEK